MPMTPEQARENARKSHEARKAKKEAQAQAAIPIQLLDSMDSDADGASPFQFPTQPAVKKPGPDGASQKELDGWVQVALAAITMVFALWVARGDENSPTFEAVNLSDEELKAFSTPIARLLARTDLNRQFGSKLVGSTDYLALGMALIAYGNRVAPLVASRVGSGNNVANPRPARQIGGQPPRPPAPTAGQPATAPADPAGVVYGFAIPPQYAVTG